MSKIRGMFYLTLVLICALLMLLIVKIAQNECVRTIDKTELRDYRIIKIDPPKRMYLDLQDILTGKTYTGVYISKYCPNSGCIHVGQIITLKRVSWTEGGNETTEFTELYETICN